MKRQRLQFDFTPEALKQLDELVSLMNAPSRAAVLRSALRLFDRAMRATRDGDGLVIRTRNGKDIPITII